MQNGITIFRGKFLSHSAEKFRGGTFLFFRKFLVSKNVRDKRGGGYHDFPSKLFCLTVPNHFVEEPFCVSKNFGYQKNCMPKRGISQFSIENLLSRSTEKYRRGTLLCCFRKFEVAKKFMDKRGESIKIFRRKFFVSQCRKIS